MSLPPRLLRHRASLVALAAAAAIAGYVIAAPARADDGKRRELVDAINRLLENISGELSDVPRDSSDSDLVRTIDYAAQIASKAEELKSHAGDDSEAQRMKDYPSYASPATRTPRATSAR
jgi:cytochrome c556